MSSHSDWLIFSPALILGSVYVTALFFQSWLWGWLIGLPIIMGVGAWDWINENERLSSGNADQNTKGGRT